MDFVSSETAGGLLIGRRIADRKSEFGFANAKREEPEVLEGAPVAYSGEGHLMTIAPTGAGKGVGCVIPALLRHDGPAITMDLKAENYIATRRHRASRGSSIACIDPFGVAGAILEDRGEDDCDEIRGFNPFDLLPFLSDDRATACRALAEMMISPNGHRTDPFWRDASVGALAALIDCYERLDGSSRSISAIVNDLSVEVTRTDGPGRFTRRVAGVAAIQHDPVLMDLLDRYGLDPYDLWTIYEEERSSASIAGSPLQVKTLVETAARMGHDEGRGEINLDESPEEIAQGIAKALLGTSVKIARFTDRLQAIAPDIEDGDSLPLDIWNSLTLATKGLYQPAPMGSFSRDAGSNEVAENYPLAMHRVARTPSQLCRSLAAQPYSADRTWGSILCTLRSDLAQFSGRSVAHCFSAATAIDLDALQRGDDVSLYIAFPPNRIRSHATLFRVIVEGVLAVILSRTSRPPKRTLMLLDEIAQLGHLDILVTAKTLLRGYGVQVWSFWQDISQVRANYPSDWRTIINNCRVIQVFGRGSGIMAGELAQALEIHPQMISGLQDKNLLAWIDGAAPITLQRPVCYADADLKDLCDDGPFALPSKPRPKRAEQAWLMPDLDDEIEMALMGKDSGGRRGDADLFELE